MKHLLQKGGLTMAAAVLLAIVGTGTALAAGLAQSAAKVDATVTSAEVSGAQEVRVRLAIADGWHVNTNPASLDFLVPTTIEATAGGKTVALSVAWPAGHDSGIELGGTAIQVYSDGIVIPVTLETATAGTRPTFNIRVQACSNAGLCLPPSTLQVQLQQS